MKHRFPLETQFKSVNQRIKEGFNQHIKVTGTGDKQRWTQLNHCARGTPTPRLKGMTVIHHFDLKRADGTTAAERLLRTSFPDWFDWMVERMAPLPAPRKPRTPAKFNPLKLLTVPA